MLLDIPGIMNPNDCSIDLAGYTMEIEVENTDQMHDLYLRTSILRVKGTPDKTAGTDHSIKDELFQDPFDKCKKWDPSSTLDEKRYNDTFYITAKYNKDVVTTLRNRVAILPHKIEYSENANTVNRARGDFMRHKRKLVFKWFPRGGVRLKVALDGDSKKDHMQQQIYFLMHAQRKSVMGAHDVYTPQEINYKIKIRAYFKKVY